MFIHASTVAHLRLLPKHLSVADPDLELRGGGLDFYLPWRPFSLQSFLLFLPKIRGPGPLGPSPRSATAYAHPRAM